MDKVTNKLIKFYNMSYKQQRINIDKDICLHLHIHDRYMLYLPFAEIDTILDNATSEYLTAILPYCFRNMNNETPKQVLYMFLEKYLLKSDIEQVFDIYTYTNDVLDDTFITICNYIHNNKVDINKYADKIINIMGRCELCLDEIQGLNVSPEQKNRYDRIASVCRNMVYDIEYMDYVKLYALTKFKYSAYHKINKNMLDAYKRRDVVYINKHEDVICIEYLVEIGVFRKYIQLEEDFELFDAYYLTVHKLEHNNNKYDLNMIIKMNEPLTFISGVFADRCNILHFIKSCYYKHGGDKDAKYTTEDILKYYYVRNDRYFDIFTKLGKPDVFLNFGDVMYYILDNYL